MTAAHCVVLPPCVHRGPFAREESPDRRPAVRARCTSLGRFVTPAECHVCPLQATASQR